MDERGDPATVPLDHRHRPRLALSRQLEGPALDVDVSIAVGEPVRQHERWVPQCSGERIARVPGRGRLAELNDQLGHRRARQPRS